MTYSVIYRQGGTERCRWNRVLETYSTREQAKSSADKIERQGYKTLIQRTVDLEAHGLPIGWDASTDPEDWELHSDGFYWLRKRED